LVLYGWADAANEDEVDVVVVVAALEEVLAVAAAEEADDANETLEVPALVVGLLEAAVGVVLAEVAAAPVPVGAWIWPSEIWVTGRPVAAEELLLLEALLDEELLEEPADEVPELLFTVEVEPAPVCWRERLRPRHSAIL
jgi:hypothetical protein